MITVDIMYFYFFLFSFYLRISLSLYCHFLLFLSFSLFFYIQLHVTYGAGHYVANHKPKSKSKGGPKVLPQEIKPGEESYRRSKEELTK